MIITTDTRSEEKSRLLKELSDLYHSGGEVPAKSKCCGKCAFRAGSPERSDPYGWMMAVDSWLSRKTLFFCHEGVSGHDQQVEGESISICAGYHSLKQAGVSDEVWYDLAHTSGRPQTRRQVPYFEEEAKTSCDGCKRYDIEGMTEENADSYNPCTAGKKTVWITPESPVDEQWGFFPEGWFCALRAVELTTVKEVA